MTDPCFEVDDGGSSIARGERALGCGRAALARVARNAHPVERAETAGAGGCPKVCPEPEESFPNCRAARAVVGLANRMAAAGCLLPSLTEPELAQA